MNDDPELLLVTGMSGAGRSTAARALEDQGWFVEVNLPPTLLDATVDLVGQREDVDRLAVVLDVRSGRFFGELPALVSRIRADGDDVRLLFLEASDEILLHRFESNRRPHPLQGSGTFRAVAAAASTGLSGTANQLFVAFPGEPRTWGATIKFNY